MHRRLALAAFSLLSVILAPFPGAAARKVRVMVWSERTEPKEVYPEGINGLLAAVLNREKDIHAVAANLSDEGQGLAEPGLKETDVLISFGHRHHKLITDQNVERIVRHVDELGMGYLPIHSSHFARAFQKIMQTIAERRGKPLEGIPGKWARVRNEGKPELIHVLEPKHPIAKGVRDFTIPKTETYWNPFNVPAPDLKILEGRYEGDQQDGSDGLLWQFGKGKVFYLQAGHETYPTYFQAEVQQIIGNAVRFLSAATR